MRHRPTFEEFAALARGASLVPVYRQLVGDTLTPVSAFVKIQVEGPAFLFESVVGGERLGRDSFLGRGPFLTVSAYDRQVTVTGSASGDQGPHPTTHHSPLTTHQFEHADPLRYLEDLLA